ncbi:hypothetical protein Vadar_024765 [Vaccinium darrowii]|uniref:Uncharacterized protein n=1 Tax=Vaccinium darrowii TaxID=229202 RepID=A0ACB7YZ09_9ERIC|nr:hypothetical protein Vadar_024765 [Vaccinium darrowii]
MAKSPCSLHVGNGKDHDDQWSSIMDDGDQEDGVLTYMNAASSSSSSLGTVSNGSSRSSSLSSEIVDDASSSSTNSSLNDLSDLMTQLPIKRGLSKFYQGKSQSFTTLARVTSIEDLPKKETLFRRKMIKASKSYGGGLDRYKSYTLIPKPIISKKTSRGSCRSLPCPSSLRGSFVSSCRPPMIPSEK